MFKWLGSLVDSNDKEIQRLQPRVKQINALEPEFEKLSDDELRAKTAEFKARIAAATADIREELDEARRTLEQARQRLAAAENELDRQDESAEVKQLENRVAQLDKESRKTENDVLDELLPEAFAAVREAARRAIGQRHFDVQLMGGIILHQGKIAEMKTGEGKTLVATLPLYLNALTGRGCHLVTVNDYLARRDPYWMGPIFHALGVSVASIYPMQNPAEYTPARLYDPGFDSGDERWQHFRPIARREAYEAEITYGTSAEFGFDYLRDNMVIDLAQTVQRPLNYAIVDEVDNLLIDEARTPLIIAGPEAEDRSQVYRLVDDAVSRMKFKVLPAEPASQEEREAESETLQGQFDFIAYEKNHYVKPFASAHEKLARAAGIKAEDIFGSEGGETRESENLDFEEARRRDIIRSTFLQSMVAHSLYRRDRDYVVDRDTDGKPGIIIIDESTGRRMLGRRYAEGLHQAIEAKERISVRRETKTYATVTIQNYFRMYRKLAGMTGTALTEAEEFSKIYKLEVVVIPTNKPMIREDHPDRIYKDEPTKFKAVVNEVQEVHQKKQPVLIGTVSIEKSEMLSDLLKRKGIAHQVLNAKLHEKEANIIAQAGRLSAVTVATNMAGRGVDIILGGSPAGRDEKEWRREHDSVIGLGGLHILGTERHEARRIDNQLRGRAGRQGDPGSSRFYVSLDDDIMRRFGGDRIKGIMEWAGMDEDSPIENRLLNRTIEDSQRRVEGYHFDMRKHLVQFDDVVNKHRELIYAERRKILGGANLKENILTMVRDEIKDAVASYMANEHEPDLAGLLAEMGNIFPLSPELNPKNLAGLGQREIENKLVEQSRLLYDQREKEVGADNMRMLERLIMLRTIDSLWIEHLTEMEEMRHSAGWQTLRQLRAEDAYKLQGSEKFHALTEAIRHGITHVIYHVSLIRQAPRRPAPSPMAQMAAPAGSPRNQAKYKAAVNNRKVGRNDPCPCGSGKKYKFCCGR